MINRFFPILRRSNTFKSTTKKQLFHQEQTSLSIKFTNVINGYLLNNITSTSGVSMYLAALASLTTAIYMYLSSNEEDEQNKITTSIQLNHPNDNSENLSLGFEYVWNKMFFARGGYVINVDEQDFSFGAGVNIPVSIANVSVDYAYANFTRLGSAHRFSITLGL